MKKLFFAVLILLPFLSFTQVYNEIIKSQKENSRNDFIINNRIKSINISKFWPDSLMKNYNSYDDYTIKKTYDISGNLVKYESKSYVFYYTKIENTYDGNNLIHVMETISNSNGSWITETEYKYSNTEKIYCKNKIFTDVYAKTEKKEQTVYKYDINGRLSNAFVYVPDSTSKEIKLKILFSYDSKGNMIEESYEDETGKINQKYVYKYNASGSLLSMKYYKDDFNIPFREHGYRYGLNNDTLVYFKKDSWKKTDSTYYFYNDKKQKIKECYGSPDGPDYATFTYNFSGSVTEVKEFIGERKKVTTYEYNDKNLLTIELTYDENGRYLYGKILEYEYF
ncbi:MAG TPA: hypothetical protein PKK00_08790 [Bacteroidales bacterium]|nr:hypothetical protein [Bacteroidales bacterium]HPS17432.1 hypothetical protein [Bacteroidales bacterium]